MLESIVTYYSWKDDYCWLYGWHIRRGNAEWGSSYYIPHGKTPTDILPQVHQDLAEILNIIEELPRV